MNRVHHVVLSAAACLVLGTGAAQATVITFDFNHLFTDTSVAPGTPTPWLRATFDDAIGGGLVRLRLDALALETGQFADEFWFNLDPALDPAQLVFTPVGGIAFEHSHPPDPGAGALPVPGGHVLDFKIHFKAGGGDQDLQQGEFAVIDIGLLGGALTAASFDFFSEPGGDGTRILAATHIQGTGPDNEDSAWVAATRVPEPGPFGFACVALGGAGYLRRRR
jgi:hypothetical protein